MSYISIVSDIPRGAPFAVIVKEDGSTRAIPFHKFAKSWTSDFQSKQNIELPDFSSKSHFVYAPDAVIRTIDIIAGEKGILDPSSEELDFILSPFREKAYRSMRRTIVAEESKEDASPTDKAKEEAMKVARMIGCRGVHKNKKGEWMPCGNSAILSRISNAAESDDFLKKKSADIFSGEKEVKKRVRKKRKMRRHYSDGWENLRLRGVTGIDRISSGIVSAPVGKSARLGPEYVRDNDPDVFTDPESARARSRQLGCIGISRRVSKTGKTVWMPCTNMSDYSRVAGTTPLGRRRGVAERQSEVRRIVRQELDALKKKK